MSVASLEDIESYVKSTHKTISVEALGGLKVVIRPMTAQAVNELVQGETNGESAQVLQVKVIARCLIEPKLTADQVLNLPFSAVREISDAIVEPGKLTVEEAEKN